ncbi:unnamed protein product, partial [Rotaria magnacalcarata]
MRLTVASSSPPAAVAMLNRKKILYRVLKRIISET